MSAATIDAELPLVDRLKTRSRAVFLAAEAGPADDLSAHLKEAAAEIERLRAAIIRIYAINDNPAHFSAEINAVCDTILRPDLVQAPTAGSVSTPEVKP